MDLNRSDWLPPYNDEHVKGTIEEISLHFNELLDQVSASQKMQQQLQQEQDDDDEDGNNGAKSSSSREQVPMELRPSMTLHDASIKRNKRCLLAYHAYRINKLRELRSETSVFPAHLRPLLCEAEVDFWTEYEFGSEFEC